jgi:outer membrane protein OmpA-like peptidoglycan-associated protein
MRIFIFILVALFFVELGAQQKSQVQMTAAEYQNLMETILKARQKRAYIYQYNRMQLQYQMEQAKANQPAVQDRPVAKVDEIEKTSIKQDIRSREIIQEEQPSSSASKDMRFDQLNREIADLKRELEMMEDKQINEKQNNLREFSNLERKLDKINDNSNISNFDDNDLQRFLRNQEKMSSDIATLRRDVDQSPQNLDTRIRDLDRDLRKIEAAQTIWFATQSSDDETTNVSSESMKAIQDWAARMAVLQTDLDAVKDNDDYAKLSVDFDRLAKEVEVLKNIKPPTVPKVDLSKINGRVADMQREIDQLKRQLAQKESAPKETINNSRLTMDINTFVTKHRQKNIYFGNGSSQLTESEKSKINEIAFSLKRYDNIDIIIKGFASNVGSKATNEALSEGRALAVRDYIRSIGVTADRINLEPLGVDSSMSDPANARRAEIHLYISKN